MKRVLLVVALSFVALAGAERAGRAEGLDPATQAKVTQRLTDIRAWAADPKLVSAVKKFNAQPPEWSKSMTQEKWKSLSMLDPIVKELSLNEAAQVLRSARTDDVTEAFLSGADGTKVALLSKCTNWSHRGKPKHDVPMTGKLWQGTLEADESSGQQQIQVAVPVLDGKKPIGSLVVGLRVGAAK